MRWDKFASDVRSSLPRPVSSGEQRTSGKKLKIIKFLTVTVCLLVGRQPATKYWRKLRSGDNKLFRKTKCSWKTDEVFFWVSTEKTIIFLKIVFRVNQSTICIPLSHFCEDALQHSHIQLCRIQQYLSISTPWTTLIKFYGCFHDQKRCEIFTTRINQLLNSLIFKPDVATNDSWSNGRQPDARSHEIDKKSEKGGHSHSTFVVKNTDSHPLFLPALSSRFYDNFNLSETQWSSNKFFKRCMPMNFFKINDAH